MADDAPYFSHFTTFTLDIDGAHVAEDNLLDHIDWLNLTSCATGESYLVFVDAIADAPTLAEVLDGLHKMGIIGGWVQQNVGCIATYRRVSYPKPEAVTKEQELALAERAGKPLN